MSTIPDGFAVIPGRSRDTSIRLIAAAKEVGVDPTLVRTQSDGYLVPEDVADYFTEHKDELVEHDEVTGARLTGPIDHTHTPLTFDTLHPEETDDRQPVKEGEAAVVETETNGGTTTDAPKADGESEDVPTNEFAGPEDGAPEPTAEDERPAGNASKDAWAEWAAKWHGYEATEDLSRDELKDKYPAPAAV